MRDLYELSGARKIYFRSCIRTARRNAMCGYVFRNDVSGKFTFDDGDQWPLAIGSDKFRHAAPCMRRVCSQPRDLRERRKCITEMDNDVEVIHPRSAKAIKQHSTQYKSRIVDFATRISLGQLRNLTPHASDLSIINGRAA